jgi:hypothetical protein
MVTLSGADVRVVSDTEVRCKLPAGTAGSYQPVMNVDTFGIVSYATGVTDSVTFDLVISNFTPLKGSEDGGNVLTITGTGFWQASGHSASQ